MLLQVKVILVCILYFFGVMFMCFFPPRNYKLSGSKLRSKRALASERDVSPEIRGYLSYNTMLDQMDRIVKDYSEVAKLVKLSPLTAKNRSLVALEIKSDQATSKPGILIVGALNAMVWGAPTAIIELARKLLYDSTYQTPFLHDYDWYFIPLANPDGLEFTKSLQELTPIDDIVWSQNQTARQKTRPSQWHKNVDAESSNTHCFGTNINRNFAYHWQDDVHSMPHLCSQYYSGLKPFSTGEAQALRDYLANLDDNLQLAIHLHASFTLKKEYILFPWRYSLRQPSNFRTLQNIGEYAARKARLPDGRFYEVHQSSNDNRVAGSLTDYLSGVVGTDLVYLVKPYFPKFPNISDSKIIDLYTQKSIAVMLSLVRGWRSNNKANTLYFFGEEVEF